MPNVETFLPDPHLARIDREAAFLLFATFCGDVSRTAVALGIPPKSVQLLVDEEGWADKLRPIVDLHAGASKPGDVERAVNRAVNFVQAHTLRIVAERVLANLRRADDAGLMAAMTVETPGRDGSVKRVFSTRPLADLASAIEKAHLLSYAALADSGKERAARADEGNPQAATALHAQLAQAMTAAMGSQTPRAQLFDTQLAQANELRARARMLPSEPKVEPS